jgi:hypothetical protein
MSSTLAVDVKLRPRLGPYYSARRQRVEIGSTQAVYFDVVHALTGALVPGATGVSALAWLPGTAGTDAPGQPLQVVEATPGTLRVEVPADIPGTWRIWLAITDPSFETGEIVFDVPDDGGAPAQLNIAEWRSLQASAAAAAVSAAGPEARRVALAEGAAAAKPFADAAADSEAAAIDEATKAAAASTLAVNAQQAAGGSKTDAALAAANAQAALAQVSTLIAGAAALGTQLSAAAGFNNPAIATGQTFFVATPAGAVLYVKGATLEATQPSTNPALVLPAAGAVDQRLPLDGSKPMQGALALGGNAVTGVSQIDLALVGLQDDDYVHLLRPLGPDGLPRLFAALNKRNGMLALGALEDESRVRLALALYGAGLSLPAVTVGEDGLLDLFSVAIAAGQTGRSFALNVRDGTVSLGALDAESRARVGRDLFGAGIDISTAEIDDAGIVDVFGLKNPAGQRTRSVGINPRTGEVALGALDRDSRQRLAADLTSFIGGRPLGVASLASSITYVPQGGQSLATGEITVTNPAIPANEPVILSTAPLSPNAWMLNTGLRGVLGQALDATKLTDFAPAQDDFDGFRGQSPGSAMMAHLHRENLKRGILHDMVWRGHARGGRTIAQLQEGSGSFENAVTELQKAVFIAAAYGREISMPAIVWTQGEQDRATAEQTYLDALVTLRNSYNARMLPVLPAGHPAIALLMDQVSASSNAGPGTPAQIAQYRAARDLAGFYLVGPHYQLLLSDTVHLRAEGYALLGEYQARAWHQIFRLGNASWKPVMPTSVSRSDNVVRVVLNRPDGAPIVYDATTLPPHPNGAWGFEYEGASITNVALTDGAAGIIDITLSSAVGGKLSYAWTSFGGGYGVRAGAWGNVRDDYAGRSVTLPRMTLLNWCVTFQETVA